jgi:hypothetical protein
MKKYFLTFIPMLFLLSIQNVYSQGGTTPWVYQGNNITDPKTQFLGTTSYKDLRIRTNNFERMVIDSDGYVGIGTITPKNLQHISSKDSVALFSQFTNASTGDSLSNLGFRIGIDSIGNAVLFNNYADTFNGNMNFFTNGSQRMTIYGLSGNIGIGTTEPVRRLEVRENANVVSTNFAGRTITATVTGNFVAENPTAAFQVGLLGESRNDTVGYNYGIAGVCTNTVTGPYPTVPQPPRMTNTGVIGTAFGSKVSNVGIKGFANGDIHSGYSTNIWPINAGVFGSASGSIADNRAGMFICEGSSGRNYAVWARATRGIAVPGVPWGTAGY